MTTVTQLINDLNIKFEGLRSKLVAISPNPLVYAAVGEAVLYGCKVTEGSDGSDMEISLEGQASGDSENFNPDYDAAPIRAFQYANIASMKDGAFTSQDLTTTVPTAPSEGLARYDIAVIYVGPSGAGFSVITGTPSSDVKDDFDLNGLDDSPYGSTFDPALPVGALPVARIYVEGTSGIPNSRIADLRVFGTTGAVSQAEYWAGQAAASALSASNSALACADSEEAAEDASDAAVISAGLAEGFADDAQGYASAAQESAGLAEGFAGDAESAALAVAGVVEDATDQKLYAQEWAIKPEDTPVSVDAGGDGVSDYSALHWAKKAEEYALAADGTLTGLVDTDIEDPENNQVLKYDSATSKWINASNPAGVSDLVDLTDVTITTPSNGQILTYDEGVWINAAAPSGVDALIDLTDVNITSISDKDILAYDSTAEEWKNVSLDTSYLGDFNTTTPSEGQVLIFSTGEWVNGTVNLEGLGNVTITTPANGQVLTYNGSAWINSAPASVSLSDLSNVTITTPANGQVLTYDGSAWINSAASGGTTPGQWVEVSRAVVVPDTEQIIFTGIDSSADEWELRWFDLRSEIAVLPAYDHLVLDVSIDGGSTWNTDELCWTLKSFLGLLMSSNDTPLSEDFEINVSTDLLPLGVFPTWAESHPGARGRFSWSRQGAGTYLPESYDWESQGLCFDHTNPSIPLYGHLKVLGWGQRNGVGPPATPLPLFNAIRVRGEYEDMRSGTFVLLKRVKP